MTPSHSQFGLIGVLSVILVGVTAAAAPQTRLALDQPFQQQLQLLADRCAELKLPAQADITRQWFLRRAPDRQYLFLPTRDDPHAPRDSQPRLVKLWADKFRQLRREQAKRLFTAARQSLAVPDAQHAYRLLHEVLHEQPDHAEALAILGYTPGARRRPRARAGRAQHPQFGWPRGKHWNISSPHFTITTSHSARAGLQLAQQLEDMLVAWRQLFFDFWGVKASLKARFNGGKLPLARPGASQKFAVVLFRDREEYTSLLAQIEPQIARTVGYYQAARKRSFFFANDSTVATRFHEATHQFFQESRRVLENVGESSDFWMVEGIALYMESLERYPGYCTVGGFDANRLQFARQRLVNEKFYLSLGELSALGRQALQEHPRLRRLYSQSAGLTHFLIDGADGQYRPGMLKYLQAIYLGRSNTQSLAASLETPLDSLDKAYGDFLGVTEQQLQHLKPASRIRNLCLARAKTTSAGLARLIDYDQLEWLDISFSGADDRLLVKLPGPLLEKLNLEGTAISDAALANIGSFTNLRELDLSQTNVGDDGIAHLQNLRQLEVLYLTSTKITDAGLRHLESLKNLEILDVGKTEVSNDALQRLTEQLPRIESR